MRTVPAAVFLLTVFLLTVLWLAGAVPATAENKPLHPPFPLKDAAGKNVLETGNPVSAAQSCTLCHDTQYITAHSYHVDADPGAWDPLTYRTYGPPVEGRLDLGRADWIRILGRRHVGGGPAALDDDGKPLETLVAGEAPNADTHVWDAAQGKAVPWDWSRSGALELDCFLCHIRRPAFEARNRELAAGRFRWAPTATLGNTGLVRREGDAWRWQREAFDAEGRIDLTRLAASGHKLAVPDAENCGLCHGPVPGGPAPLMQKDLLGQWNAETRGQVFAAQRLRASALNLAGKDELHRPFDVHAERLLACRTCHHAPNNPAYESRAEASRPRHLAFDARRPDIEAYLGRPNHNLARGRDDSMMGCADCHVVEGSHEWLPYLGTHLAALRCEVCHVPHVHAPARRVTDWTVLRPGAQPRIEYRGVEGPVEDAASLVTGFAPLLLERGEPDGERRLTPYNLIAFWYWAAGEAERPVRLADLEQAYFEGDAYHPAILAALDENGDGALQEGELALDAAPKVAAVRARLAAVGVKGAHIRAEMRPYALHHTVAAGAFATRECSTCHSENSAVAASIDVAAFAPGGVQPTWAGDARVRPAGTLTTGSDGALRFEPDPGAAHLHVLGHDRQGWIDALGIVAVLLVLLGAGTHGVARIVAARRRRRA